MLRSSARNCGTVSDRPRGIVATTPAMATSDSTATAQNADRHPRCWPSSVPAGSPTIVATVSPPARTLIALARAAGPASSIAVTDATAQNPAYTKALATRVASSTPYDDVTAPATW